MVEAAWAFQIGPTKDEGRFAESFVATNMWREKKVPCAHSPRAGTSRPPRQSRLPGAGAGLLLQAVPPVSASKALAPQRPCDKMTGMTTRPGVGE